MTGKPDDLETAPGDVSETVEAPQHPRQTVPPARRGTWPLRLIVLAALAAMVVYGALLVWPRSESQLPAEPALSSGTQPVTPTAPEAPPDQAPDAEDPAEAHPLEPVLTMAREGLARIRNEIDGYSARITKRERIKGKLNENVMFAKIRNRRTTDGQVTVPFSVYLKFLEPPSLAGREVIWVEGQNDGKLIAHETGLANLMRFKLDPKGFLAMMGNRYPIMDIGMENLISKLIKKGEENLQYNECLVEMRDDAETLGRKCTLIEIHHPEPRPYFDFHLARIYIDGELRVPIRYAAYKWPEQPGGEPVLDEEYMYEQLKLNVGLTDLDFDPDNPAYEYP